MKKWVLIVIAILIVALSSIIGIVISQNNDSNFVFSLSPITLEVNTSKDIEYQSSDNCEVDFSVTNTDIATVVNKKVYAHKTGKTYLEAQIKHNNKIYYRSVALTVNDEIPSFHFDYENSMEIYFGDDTNFSPTIEKGNPVFNFTSSNANIATINSSGIITTKQCGTVEINVLQNNLILKTCIVTITPNFVLTSNDNCTIDGHTIIVPSGIKTTFEISLINSQNEDKISNYQPLISPNDLNCEYVFYKYSITPSISGVIEIHFNQINTVLFINVEIV